MSMRPDDHRRKWNKEEYAKKAAKRKQDEVDKEEAKKNKSKEPPVKRELLKPREKAIDFDSQVGSTRLIKANSLSDEAGYFCEVCDITVKNSITYLDHVNGKKHQKNLGMSMKVERSSLDAVKNRLAFFKNKKEEKVKEYDLADRLKDVEEEEEKLKEYRKEQKKEKKRKANDIESNYDNAENEMARLMGFSSFNTSKKPK